LSSGTPPTPEQLAEFAKLAEKLEERYRVEAEALGAC
jgi:hypothetical protein